MAPDAPKLDNIFRDKQNVLTETVPGLLSMYYAHRDSLPIQPPYLAAALGSDKKVHALMTRVLQGIQGVSSTLYSKMLSGAFVVWDLTSHR